MSTFWQIIYYMHFQSNEIRVVPYVVSESSLYTLGGRVHTMSREFWWFGSVVV